MRLIDADAFKKYIIKGFEEMKSQFKTEFYLDIATRVTESFLEDIDEQPTVEAQPTDAEREAYIKGYDYGVKDWFKSKTQPCEDAVSRSEAITELTALIENFKGIQGDMGSAVNSARELIKTLSIVMPQRKKGKWIEVNRGIHVTDYRCSECGRIVRDDTGYDVSADYPYCHCGAEMSGGRENADSD